jgi:DNA-binding HxlR family transcriptional regulator
MPLGSDYDGQDCSLARALEVVGERWTLLVLRDCLLGVRRFSDLLTHLDISRAVLAARLADLVDAGLLERHEYRPGRHEYRITDAGADLWPAVHALMRWGEQHRSPGGRGRVFFHAACDAEIDATGACPRCASRPGPADLEVRPGPALVDRRADPDRVPLPQPHRLRTPLPS